MTYCDNQWVSDFTYEGMMDFFLRQAGRRAATGRASNVMKRLLVVGTIDPTRAEPPVLQALFTLDADEIKERIPGDYAIVFRNDAGSELARYPFTPDVGEGGAGDPTRGVDLLFINELVPYVEGVTRVDIEGAAGPIVTAAAGSAEPVVAGVSTEDTVDGTIAVAWQADEPDGDPLTFNLQYSADDGSTWETLAQNIVGTSAEIDPDDLVRGEQARFRVVASDGIRSSVSDSTPLVVENHRPTVDILAPSEGTKIDAGETLLLTAKADDADIGSLNEQITWRARDRVTSGEVVIGRGARFDVETCRSDETCALREGDYDITCEADDGEGGRAAAGPVRVTVGRKPVRCPPPNALPDLLSAAPCLIGFDPTGGETHASVFLSNANYCNPSIQWSAEVSEPWLLLDKSSGLTPEGVIATFQDIGLELGTHVASITYTSSDLPGQTLTCRAEVNLSCAGDCNGDHRVDVQELVRGIRIALGEVDLVMCTRFDRNGSRQITVDELVSGVSNVLDGCSQ